jgi:hypothetical protein
MAQNHSNNIQTPELDQGNDEDFLNVGVALLAAFTYIPISMPPKSINLKYKVGKLLADNLLEKTNLKFTEKWLLLLRHPTSCINVVKALYSLCISSTEMCKFIANRSAEIDKLLDILQEKVCIF